VKIIGTIFNLCIFLAGCAMVLWSVWLLKPFSIIWGDLHIPDDEYWAQIVYFFLLGTVAINSTYEELLHMYDSFIGKLK